ncbi:hypothetical protein [Acetobacter persici]|uniref:Core-binding (CB) domain-containing protein n=1 Tax=Acetobacter persici TaxID=1076596 RepID=A0A6V8I9C2_9PROT|nr:hypothetical protein [Acetobacter persici]OUI90009.1 hypothetical protein HK19_12925 [Acetobacter persici]GFE93657.1 hypothetical protein DmAi_17160 [Acetobacter persici]
MPRIRNDKPHLEKRRGKWAIVWWEDGKRRRLSTGTDDEKNARQALVDFENTLEKQPLKMSLSTAFERYVASRSGKISDLKRLQEAIVPLSQAMGYLRVDQVDQSAWDTYAANRLKKADDQKPRMFQFRRGH